jgi:hypothetical protein
MRLALITLLLLVHFATIAQPAPKNTSGIAFALFYGAGRQAYQTSPETTIDGHRILRESNFVKAVGFAASKQLTTKGTVAIAATYAYDYTVNFNIDKRGSGLSIGIDVGTELYDLWTIMISYQHILWKNRRMALLGFGGLGAELFTSNYYYKVETKVPYANPTKGYTFYNMPTTVNRSPIPTFNLGLEFDYSIGRNTALLTRLDGKYATRPFVSDHIRFEGASGSTLVTTAMNGSVVTLSIGLKYSF